MTLEVRLTEHADVAACIAIRIATLGSLVIGRPPPYPGYVEESETSMHNDLDTKPHVYHLKVVDSEHDTEVLAYAKWEVYEQGRPDLEQLQKALTEPDDEPASDQFGALSRAATQYFCSRNGEMGKFPHLRESPESVGNMVTGKCSCGLMPVPHIVLALLVTAEQHRGRGAGRLLLKWGINFSESDGHVPIYLQASEQGRKLYSYYGFNEMGSVKFDLSEFGLDGVEVMTEMIRKPTGGQS